MRTTLKLVLLGTLPALVVVPALGSDPVARPAVGMPRAPSEAPNLEPLSRPRVGSSRDGAVRRTQIPEELPELSGRMPSSRTRPEAFPPTPAPAQPALASPDLSEPTPADAAGAEFPTEAESVILPPMIGDQAPLSVHSYLIPAAAPVGQGRLGIAVPWARGFKIADNMSPRPMDRVFFTFNYFNNLNGNINDRVAPNLGGMEAYRYLFGYEKTFWDGNASVGLRLPLNTLTVNGRAGTFGGTSTAVGSLTVFSKLILWQQPGTANLVSGGLAVTAPTGPSAFGGAPGVFAYRDAQLQPFLGYSWSRGRFYLQGFEAIDVPTDSRDVTMLYNDLGVGYFAYRSADPGAFLSAVAPTFETHVNVPLNHAGAFRGFDPAGTPDVVDLTFGVHVLLRQRSLLTVGFVEPVTGPRPFDYEWTVLFNTFFGRTRDALIPPVAGL